MRPSSPIASTGEEGRARPFQQLAAGDVKKDLPACNAAPLQLWSGLKAACGPCLAVGQAVPHSQLDGLARAGHCSSARQ